MGKMWHSLNGRLLLYFFIVIISMFLLCIFFYQSFSNTVQGQLYDKINTLSIQMEDSLTASINAISSASQLAGYSSSAQTYLLSQNPVNVIFSASKATEFWGYAFGATSICKNIYLYSENGRYLFYNQDYREVFSSSFQEYGFTTDITLNQAFFSDVFYINANGSKSNTAPAIGNQTPYIMYFSPVYSILSGTASTKNRTISAIICDLSGLINWLSVEYPRSITTLFYEGVPLATDSSYLSDHLFSTMATLKEEQKKINYNNKSYICKKSLIPNLNAFITYMVPQEDVVGDLTSTLNGNLMILIFVTTAIILCMFLILRSIQNAINAIVYDTTHLRTKNGATRVRVSDLKELKAVSISINNMIERIDKAVAAEKKNEVKLYKARLAQNNAELIGYRSQINPHFLFNTLECMRSMAHIHKIILLEETIGSMAKMFRYSLYAPMFVTFQEELSQVTNYITVMNIRFQNRFTLKSSVSKEAGNYIVVSMVAQPLVENAVLHAFTPKQKNCTIFISAHIDEEKALVVKVIDNGVGLTEAEISAIESGIHKQDKDLYEEKNSISLQNIFVRMKLTFGNRFHIRLHSRKGCYTCVTLYIPNDLANQFLQ